MEYNNNERKIRSLDLEFSYIQSENFSNDFEIVMKKEKRRNMISGGLIVTTILLSLTGTLVFNEPIIALAGSGVSLAITCISSSKIFKKTSKNSSLNHSNVVNINREKNVSDVLSKGIDKKTSKDFYTARYISFLRNIPTNLKESNEFENQMKQRIDSLNEITDAKEYEDESKRIDEAIMGHMKNTPVLKIVEEDRHLDKEEAETRIIDEIDAYSQVYRLPNFKISDTEWDLLFNSVYSLLNGKNVSDEYYDVMSEITRITLANSLLKNRDQINIHSFVEDLRYLKHTEITPSEIKDLQETMLGEVNSNEIIDFCEYRNQRQLKK